jgi:hypothetical protein
MRPVALDAAAKFALCHERQTQRGPTWQEKVNRAFLTNHQASRLAKVTRVFLTIEHFREAVRLEWTDVQLFGVCPDAPWVRVESWGLITGLALSPHNRLDSQGRYQQTKLDSIDAAGATTITPTGSRAWFDRFHIGLDLAVPWWEVAVLQV